MQFIKQGFTLPIPLNLIPTPVTFYYSIRRIIDNWKKRREAAANRNNSLTTPFDDLTIHNDYKSQGSFPNINNVNIINSNSVANGSNNLADLNHKVVYLSHDCLLLDLS